MNLYRMTYHTDDPEDIQTMLITERSEKDARKFFKGVCKNGTITDSELVREGVTATKAQERETLAKIREMVEELGPESYLKTAFKGTFEDAEQNIEDDGAYSYFDRAQLAEAEVKELEGKIKELEGGVAELIQKDDERKAALERLEGKTIPPALYKLLWVFVADAQELAVNHMAQAAELMAGFAERPSDIAFTDAVKSYRTAKEQKELCEGLLHGLEPLEV